MGLKIGLSRNDALNMRYGELMDLISCYQIDNGQANPATQNVDLRDLV